MVGIVAVIVILNCNNVRSNALSLKEKTGISDEYIERDRAKKYRKNKAKLSVRAV